MCLAPGARKEWYWCFSKLSRQAPLSSGVLFQVVRAAEEAASTLASSIHPEQCIKVLCPIIQTADYPINLAAIKMQTKVVERITKESLLQLLVDIIPGLLQVRCCGGPTWDLRLFCLKCFVSVLLITGSIVAFSFCAFCHVRPPLPTPVPLLRVPSLPSSAFMALLIYFLLVV